MLQNFVKLYKRVMLEIEFSLCKRLSGAERDCLVFAVQKSIRGFFRVRPLQYIPSLLQLTLWFSAAENLIPLVPRFQEQPLTRGAACIRNGHTGVSSQRCRAAAAPGSGRTLCSSETSPLAEHATTDA